MSLHRGSFGSCSRSKRTYKPGTHSTQSLQKNGVQELSNCIPPESSSPHRRRLVAGPVWLSNSAPTVETRSRTLINAATLLDKFRCSRHAESPNCLFLMSHAHFLLAFVSISSITAFVVL